MRSLMQSRSIFRRIWVPVRGNTASFSNKSESSDNQNTILDTDTIALLERLALVDFVDKVGVKRLEATVNESEVIKNLDTTDVEPQISPLDDRALYLRPDEVTEKNTREEMMKNAVKTSSNYFICPPGNIAVQPTGEYK